jgi:hypothetical protein
MPVVITRIGVVLAIVILVAGCGNARQSLAQLAPNLTVSEKDDGGKITLEVGQVVLVRLTAGAGYNPWSRPTSSNSESLAWLATQPASLDRVTRLLLAATSVGSSDLSSGSSHICPGSYTGPETPGAVYCSDGASLFSLHVRVIDGAPRQFDLMTQSPKQASGYRLREGDTLAVDGMAMNASVHTKYGSPDSRVLATLTDPRSTHDGNGLYRAFGPGTTNISYSECPANPQIMLPCLGFNIAVTVVAQSG